MRYSAYLARWRTQLRDAMHIPSIDWFVLHRVYITLSFLTFTDHFIVNPTQSHRTRLDPDFETHASTVPT